MDISSYSSVTPVLGAPVGMEVPDIGKVTLDPLVVTLMDLMMSSTDHGVLFGTLSRCTSLSDRKSVFEDFLRIVGRNSFRFLPVAGDRRDKFRGVCYYDGRLWVQVDGILLRESLKRYLIVGLHMSSGEWFKGESRFVDALIDGAHLSLLSPSKSVVGFSNGVYDFTDLDNIVYYPYGDGMQVTGSLPYDYVPGSGCPLWERFLSQILDSSQRLLLQKFMSLGLVDRSKMENKIEQCLWMVGPGGAGKSTIQNVISYVYGEDNVSSLSLGQLLSGGNDERSRYVALLSGKTFNFCKEVQLDDMTRHVDSFKSLCSGEPQQMRRIGGDVMEMREVPYLVFNMNRKPMSRNIDNALLRRILFLNFRSALRGEDMDTSLEDRLKQEASGIRNWLIEGYKMLRADGFKFTSTTKAEMDESDEWFIQNGLTVELFLKKNDVRYYSFAGKNEQGRWFPVKVLYAFYSKWCEKWGYDKDADSESSMGRTLRGMGFLSKRQSMGISYRVYGAQGLV